jgi:hypothetical protein
MEFINRIEKQSIRTEPIVIIEIMTSHDMLLKWGYCDTFLILNLSLSWTITLN